jgi:hypothetical protein
MPFVKFLTKAVSYCGGIGVVILWIMGAVLLAMIFRDEGLKGIISTFKVDILRVTIKYISILFIFFTIAGAVDHLQRRHDQEFKRLVGGEHGPVIMMMLGSVLPGPAGAKQMHDGWHGDGNKRYILLALTSMMALGMNTLIFRSKLLGGELTLIWMGMALAFLGQVYVAVTWIIPLSWLD